MWYNSIVKPLLHSPIHWFISKSVMTITINGRQSGRSYTIPVNYIRDKDTFYTISYRNRTWWRNLIDGASVTLHVQGKDLQCRAEVSCESIESELTEYIKKSPQTAKYFQIKLDSHNQPDAEDIARASQELVLVRSKKL